MNDKKIIHNLLIIRITYFVVGFGGIFAVLFISNLLGVNGYSIIEGDLREIYIPLIRNLIRDILNGENLSYSMNVGYGLNTTLAYAMDAYSPFNVVFMLDKFISINTIVAISIAIRSGLSAMAIGRYFRVRKVCSFRIGIIGALMYSLCAFQTIYTCNAIMWLDAMWVLPLLLCEIEEFFDDHYSYRLFLTYAYIFITNFYMGYIIGISSFIFFGVLFAIRAQRKGIKAVIIVLKKYVIAFVSAIGISAFVWVPAIMFLLNNRAEDSTGFSDIGINLPDVYNQLFIGEVGTLYNSNPSIYCGCIALIVLPICLLKWKNYFELTGQYAITLIILAIACVVKPLYILLHAFDAPDGWNYRFSFVISLMICMIVTIFLENIEECGFVYILAVLTINVGIYSWEIKRQEYGQNMAGMNDINFLVINAIFISVISVLVYLYGRSKKDIMLSLIGIIVGFEMIMSGYLSHYRRSEVLPEIPMRIQDNSERSMQSLNVKIAELDNKYRINMVNEIMTNPGTYNGYMGTSYFYSFENASVRETLKKIGIWNTTRSIKAAGYNEITKMILGVKYDVTMPSYEALLNGDTECLISENKHALALGYMVDEKLKDFSFDGDDAFDNTNRLLSSMTGEKVSPYISIEENDVCFEENGLVLTKDNDYSYVSWNEEDTYPQGRYIEFKVKSDEDVFAYVVNDRSLYTQEGYKVLGGEENAFYPYGVLSVSYIKRLDEYDKGEQSLIIYCDGNKIVQPYKKICFASINDEEVDRIYTKLSEHQLNIDNIRNGHLKGSINSTEGLLFTSIPYDKGWNVYVDGEKQSIVPVLDNTFCGVKFDTFGEHDIDFKYTASGKILGMVISGMVMVAYLVSILFHSCVDTNWGKRSNL